MLNLPQTITKNDGSTVVYVYSALGNKLRKLFTAGGITTTTEYDNGIEYDNSTTNVAFIQTEEGRARHSGTTYTYEYDLKDHLGNTRVTLTPDPNDPTQQTAKILQENDYYAFGYGIQSMQGIVASPKNEYLYNHKELQEETGLYDYGARFYDPVIARWTSVDPLAEVSRRWSPYDYVENNPIKFTDPDGMAVSYDASGGATYTGQDAVNVAWGLKIAGETRQEDKDKDRAEAKKDAEERKKAGIGFITPENAPKLKPLSGFWAKLGYAISGRSFNGISYDSDGNPTGYTPITGSPDLISGPVGELNEISHAVYYAKNFEEEIVYVGRTNNLARRAIEQLAMKGIKIIPLMENLTFRDARAVEQALIELHGLEKKGGSLVNLINSIAKTNPKYAKSLARGYELLEWIGYKIK